MRFLSKWTRTREPAISDRHWTANTWGWHWSWIYWGLRHEHRQYKERNRFRPYQAGKGMDIYYQLGLDKLDCSIAIIQNARAINLARKRHHQDLITFDIDLDVLGYVDPMPPYASLRTESWNLNIRSGFGGHHQHCRCKNPRCITSTEQEIDHTFKLVDRENKVYRCIYCESKLKIINLEWLPMEQNSKTKINRKKISAIPRFYGSRWTPSAADGDDEEPVQRWRYRDGEQGLRYGFLKPPGPEEKSGNLYYSSYLCRHYPGRTGTGWETIIAGLLHDGGRPQTWHMKT